MCVYLRVVCNNKTIPPKKEKRSYTLPKSKIRKKCFSFFNIKKSKKFIAFFSISFPENMPDNVCFQAFNTWLTRCRKLQGLRSYLWVAERQKNNTLHFHLLTNNRMNIKEVNGYMGKSILNLKKKGVLGDKINVPENYNGVDVDNLYYSKRHRKLNKPLSKKEAQKRLSYYITKYISKNNEKFNRLAWHCSRDISSLFTSVRFTADEMTNLYKVMITNKNKIKVVKDEYFTLFVLLFDVPEEFFAEMFRVNNLIYNSLQKSKDKLSC